MSHRNSLFSWYSLLLLRDYRRVFGSNSEAGQLDNVSRRFAWFRRILKTHEDDNALLFPPAWNVGAVLAGGFSEVTRYEYRPSVSLHSCALSLTRRPRDV